MVAYDLAGADRGQEAPEDKGGAAGGVEEGARGEAGGAREAAQGVGGGESEAAEGRARRNAATRQGRAVGVVTVCEHTCALVTKSIECDG